MAENVDLGTFTFDAQSVGNNIERLRKEMFALRAEQKEYAQNSKELDKATKDLVSEQNKLIQAGKEGSKQYKDNTKALEALVKVNYDNFKAQQATGESLKKVNAEYNQSKKAIDSLKNSEGELVTATEAINIALDNEIKSIADARASNKELLALRNQLSIAGGENQEELKLLNEALDRNNAFIKENVSAYEQQKIGIGDYQTAIENALGGTKLFGVGLSDVKNSLNQFAPVLNLIKGELTSIKDSFNAAKTSSEGFSTAQKAMAVTTAATSGALKLFKLALISTGLGAIVVVLGSLIAYLSTTQAGIDKVTSVLRPLQAIFQSLLGVLQKVGETMFNAFSNPKQALTDLVDFIKNNVINRFKAFGVILEAIENRDFKGLRNGIAQAATGIENLEDKIKDGAKATASFLKEAAAKGAEVDRLTKEIERDQLAYNRQLEKTNDLIDEQQLKAKDTSLTFKEREKAANEIIRLTKELGLQEEEIIKKQIRKLGLEQSYNDTKREGNQEMIDLEAKLNAAQDRGIDAEIEQLRVVAGARKEAAAAAMANAKKQQDLSIKSNEEKLALFRAEVGFRKKSDEEQLDIARQTRDKELEILEQKFEFELISSEDYGAKVLEVNDKYLELQRDLTIANAEAERDALLKELDKRKNDYAEYTEANLELDRANIAERLAVEQDFAEQQLEQGVINQEEFDTILSELRAEARDAEQEAVIEFEEANKARLLVDAENERILTEQKYNDQFELQKFRLEQRRLAEVAAAEKTGADVTLINEKYAKYNEDINAKQQESKVQLASDAFNNIATILGKESAVGKAVAIAQTTIDTYKSATAAYSALAGITIVGPVLGALAAGAAVAAGLANVRKITSSKPPKAERGMRVPRWGTLLRGRSHKQGGIPIEAEGGEAIINKRSTSMFGGLLSAINVAGGGIPLAARGALVGGSSSKSSSIQNRLLQDVSNSQMSEMVADAVRQGSMEGSAIGSRTGSQSGIIGLSENRQVQQNSSF